ncbi:response regulator [Saliterribacillus persicus]|uniref:Two-component system response regulator YesN n=1 Tax=Saliterribacillus persicus TaxID=930114 RepID=A0A368Y3Z2_9BACI|nr:response regulator [Saliterribacillus persicus]RCW74825.1 two-component system response regulator YesN [Saliterribacillus persicus]
MKKVFLVDDEAIIRRSMAKNIEWEKEGYFYCGDASDGETALPLIEKHKPDILITDIKMPFMDGLELSRKIKNIMPDIQIIILSGHDEFEYAQKAIEIQVAEYCLKPVSADDLHNILHKVSKQIDVIKAKYNKSIPTTGSLVNELCLRMTPSHQIISNAKDLGVDIIASYYMVVVVELDNNNQKLSDFLKEYSNLIHSNHSNLICVIKHDIEHLLQEKAYDIKEKLTKFDSKIFFGTGTIETRLDNITLSYHSALEELSYNKVIQRNIKSIYSQDDHTLNQIILGCDRKKLVHFLKLGKRDEVGAFILSYTSFLNKKDQLSSLFTYYFLMDFLITVYHFIEEREQVDKSIWKELQPFKRKINHIGDYQTIKNFMAEVLEIIFAYKDQNASKYGLIIEKVKIFIEENYSNPSISLQAIASEVNISPSYLSNLFSQETENTLTEYLTKTRIHYAKELLSNTNYKTYEIAYQVGYNDSHYFCHTFKKLTGMTTKEYKLKKSEKINF